MKIKNFILDILNEQNVLRTTQTKPIVDAIKNRHPLTFFYTGPQKPKKERVQPGKRINGEAVALGLSKRGNLIVRMYIPSPNVSKKGFAKTNWRTFMVSRMSNIQIDKNKPFTEKRPQYKEGNDRSMTVTYVTSDWVKTPKITPQSKPPKQPPSKPAPPPTKPTPPKPVEPKTTEKVKPELKQPKPSTKPEKTPEIPKPEEKKVEEPKKEELPQPKTQTKPESAEPKEKENISESLKRFKTLISYK
jgi:hypothetical protein